MNKAEEYFFIVNERAGIGKKHSIWKQDLKPELIRRGIHFRIYECSHPGHATELVQKILAEHDGAVTLVVVGGDGTFNEALNGINDFSRVTIGFIPTGSANDLGYSLGIPSQPVMALEHILQSENEHFMDIGETLFHKTGEVRRFAISSGIGLDAEVCALVSNGRLKAVLNRLHLGKLVYFVNAIRIVFSQPLAEGKLIFTDEEGKQTERMIHKLYFLAGMNQRFEGGHLAMAPSAESNDGLLSFAMAHSLTRMQALISLGLLALRLHERVKGYEVVHAKACHIMLKDQLEVHTDGEVHDRHWDITVTCLPHQLKILY